MKNSKKTVLVTSIVLFAMILSLFAGCRKIHNGSSNEIVTGDIDDWFSADGWSTESDTWFISLETSKAASIKEISAFSDKRQYKWSMVWIVDGSARTADGIERLSGDIFFTNPEFTLDVTEGTNLAVSGEKPNTDLNINKLYIYLTTGEILMKEFDKALSSME